MKINKEGSYVVRITQGLYKEMPKPEDPDAFQISLKGETPDEFEIWGNMYFSHKQIQGGKNQGKTMFEANTDTLKMIGVPDGYLGNLASAIEKGLEAEFVVKNEEYNGNIELKVAFINPVKTTTPIENVDWGSIMQKFGQEKPAEMAPVEPINADKPINAEVMDTDEIPF